MEEHETWSELSNLPPEPPAARAACAQCRRPTCACWCGWLPPRPLSPRGRVVVLQHPAEARRALQTARVLELALAPGRLLLYRGKRFPQPAHEADPVLPPLRALLAAPHTLLLYPTRDAVNLQEAARQLPPGAAYTLVLVDGTWPQAKALLAGSPELRRLRAVKLPPAPGRASRYVIRAQPALGCLSTLECAAEALALLERAPHYRAALLAPLRALCDHQLRSGAVPHHAVDASPEALAAGVPAKLVGRRLSRALNS